MMRQKTFKLEPGESLRIRKRGYFFFAYARWTEYGGQKERYLGRCNSDGTPHITTQRYGGNRSQFLEEIEKRK